MYFFSFFIHVVSASFLPVLESLPVLLLLVLLSPRASRPGPDTPLKLLALATAGRCGRGAGTTRWELSELSVLLQGRGSPGRASVSVSELLLCRLAAELLARNLLGGKERGAVRLVFLKELWS